jgi:DNA adenine methylase
MLPARPVRCCSTLVSELTMDDHGQGSRAPLTAPLLKWPGGKRFLLRHLLPFTPACFDRYFEPFLGSGAVYLSLQPRRAHLSDSSGELIHFFTIVRDKPNALARALARLPNSETAYYHIRNSIPRTAVSKAARFIYLANLSFNGIYRVNKLGRFNVPYGNRPHLKVLSHKELTAVSKALANTKLSCADFDESLNTAREHDFVYLDPPYTVVHGGNGFVRYNERIFSWQDQARLAKLVHTLKKRGCHILMTNADHPSIEALYQDFAIHRIARISTIAASSQHRRSVTELIITNIEKG